MTKILTFFLIFNWRTEAMRITKKKPDILLGEVGFRVKVKLIKPPEDMVILDFGTVEIPTVIVEAESAEALAQSSAQ